MLRDVRRQFGNALQRGDVEENTSSHFHLQYTYLLCLTITIALGRRSQCWVLFSTQVWASVCFLLGVLISVRRSSGLAFWCQLHDLLSHILVLVLCLLMGLLHVGKIGFKEVASRFETESLA